MEDLAKRKKALAKKLNPKQRLFCEKYLEAKLNATQAAKLAGYSEKTARQQGSRLLTNANILAYTRVLQEELVERSVVSKSGVILDLLEIKNRCMQAVPVEKWNYETHEYEETGEYVFDSKGAISSLDKLSKLCGFDVEKNSGDDEPEYGVVLIPSVKEDGNE